jgi:hypothetical protein
VKDIIWLSPSLAAGAIAARLVVFFKRRPQIRSRRGVTLTVPSRPRVSNWPRQQIAAHNNNREIRGTRP